MSFLIATLALGVALLIGTMLGDPSPQRQCGAPASRADAPGAANG
jgi:hypothetical protein